MAMLPGICKPSLEYLCGQVAVLDQSPVDTSDLPLLVTALPPPDFDQLFCDTAEDLDALPLDTSALPTL